MYTLYNFHFLNGISEINQLFDDILIIWPAPVYRMDEIKSLSFHIMFYRLFRGVAKYIVYGTFSSFGWLRSLHATTGCEGETEADGERPELNEGLHL